MIFLLSRKVYFYVGSVAALNFKAKNSFFQEIDEQKKGFELRMKIVVDLGREGNYVTFLFPLLSSHEPESNRISFSCFWVVLGELEEIGSQANSIMKVNRPQCRLGLSGLRCG